MKQYELAIIVEQDKDGFVASCPELQGCYTQGDTYEEVITSIRDAVKLHLEDRLAGNEEILQTTSVSLSTVHVTV